MTVFRILRVDLSREHFTEEIIKEDLLKKFLGGRGLAAYLALKEIPRGIDPFDPSNKLYIFSGPLSGIATISSSRVNVTTRSPLTGVYTHSNAGGNFSYWLRKSGYDGLIIEGKADEPVYLVIKDGEPKLKPAKHIWGKWTGASTKIILEENGFPPDETKAGVAVIGPAGENLVRFAGIRLSDYERFAGRGGVGAVMGSKLLKGILVWGTRDLNKELVDRAKFMKVNTDIVKRIATHDTTKVLHRYGTNVLMNIIQSIGALPHYNFGGTGKLKDVTPVSEEYIKDHYPTETHGCYNCPIGCTQMPTVKSGPFKFTVTEKYVKQEYENTWALGPNVGLTDPEANLKLQKLANELGLDTISLGNTLSMAIELVKNGKLNLDIDWGDAGSLEYLVYKIAYRDGIGDDLAEGDYRLAVKYGMPQLFVGSRGQGLPAYDARALKGFAIAYYTANRGGDHLEAYTPTWEVFGVPEKVDPFCETQECIEKQARIVKWNQDLFAVVDSTIFCKFENLMPNIDTEKDFANLYNAAFGWDLTPQDVLTIGERIFNVERLHWVREGKWVKDELPPRMREPIPDGPAKGHTASKMFDEGIKVYYKLRGWVDGKPTRDTLKRLGLEEFDYLL
ncbi:aldehyde ferredoxin oxidoreductase family protein [Vulcanisaeta distributa]|uniref:Aldehyde ferredoxin oxidoreductase n=1 Tax=Vulcanisaeta distributa (strain DSM 14429 / JCM 11212 / NBRC 100878 / IC-017) TaxID=572478 RepID=E1QS96_VULDI|nr:aldehyde ferredoxin oxidoreductase family protein [Vulcanisaeta distributa]ADN49489.1 Aldehyde ferredoxin oxidoreductase [Vulcanisaeta distributa DSM 14429]